MDMAAIDILEKIAIEKIVFIIKDIVLKKAITLLISFTSSVVPLDKAGKKRPHQEYQIIRNSGHNIAGQQPGIVIEAIRKLLSKRN